MSNSTGSRPTISRLVPHSSQETISPLSVSISTWTSASHSGQVPVGTFSTSRGYLEGSGSPTRLGRPPTLFGIADNLTVPVRFCNTLFARHSIIDKTCKPGTHNPGPSPTVSPGGPLWLTTPHDSVPNSLAARDNLIDHCLAPPR